MDVRRCLGFFHDNELAGSLRGQSRNDRARHRARVPQRASRSDKGRRLRVDGTACAAFRRLRTAAKVRRTLVDGDVSDDAAGELQRAASLFAQSGSPMAVAARYYL